MCAKSGRCYDDHLQTQRQSSPLLSEPLRNLITKTHYENPLRKPNATIPIAIEHRVALDDHGGVPGKSCLPFDFSVDCELEVSQSFDNGDFEKPTRPHHREAAYTCNDDRQHRG